MSGSGIGSRYAKSGTGIGACYAKSGTDIGGSGGSTRQTVTKCAMGHYPRRRGGISLRDVRY
eukprot:14693-Rhodomonas_salina.4